MKIKNLIPVVIFVGVAVLFFFPSPEENFVAYFGTMLFFILLVVFLIRLKSKNSQNI